MNDKPNYEALEQRVKTLEKELHERIAAHRELHASYKLLATLVDSIEGEAFIKDAHGKYLYVNKALLSLHFSILWGHF